MALTQVLSVASVILGIYIIGVFFFGHDQYQSRQRNSNKSLQFHLGCFKAQHNLSHSMQIQKSLIQISQRNKNITKNSTTSLLENSFSNKALQVAKIFQIFMSQYNLKRIQIKNYMQLQKATRKAFQDYQYCSQVIKNGENFQETQCRSIWGAFQSCSAKLKNLKNELLRLLDKKLQTDFQAKQLLFKINRQQKLTKNLTRQISNQYFMKEKELEVEEKSIQTHLNILKGKIPTTQYSYATAKNETLHITFLYKQCVLSRKQFKLCEQLSEQVRNLGHVTLEGLWSKVERKRNYIVKIYNLLNSQHQNQEKGKYQQLRNKSLDQYKKLHRIYIQTKTKMNKSCGCTQAYEQKLFQKLQISIKNQKKLNQQLASFQQKLLQYTKSLNMVRQNKPLVLKEFQQKLKNREKAQIQEISSDKTLKNIIQNKSQLRKKIVDYETKFKDLFSICISNRNQLSSYVGLISSISDCRLKRDYYVQLNQSLKRQKRRLNLRFDNKNKLIQALKDFKLRLI